MRTIFRVPRLREASVIAGACCPVPAEAILLPELELVPGVVEAGADWPAAEVWVEHAPATSTNALLEVLEELGYPAVETKRNTGVSVGVSNSD
jgi:hypothetical protein